MKDILVSSSKSFVEHNNARFAAAIAYYMIFCLLPLLFIFTSILGLLLQNGQVEMFIFQELQKSLGSDTALFIQEHLRPNGERSLWIGALGFFLTLLGTSAVFKEMKIALDTIFKTPYKKRGSVSLVMHNLSTFFMLFATGLVVTVSFLLTLVFKTLLPYLSLWISLSAWIIESLNFILSFGVVTGLCMFLYTFVPDTRIPFRSTLVGSILTALFFTAGKTLFALYVSFTLSVGGGYGATSALFILLLWLFYSTQVFLFGAEVTAEIRKRWKSKPSIL